MPTQEVSLIIEETDWIYVEVDQHAELEELLRAAKEYATKENKKVMFLSTGRFFQVTSESDIELMAIRRADDWGSCAPIINDAPRPR